MKNYLSIGDVSKIKGISHRMLRYYDKLGILVPAFVNEKSGYRYYSKSQMVILDLIFICTDLGIPLNQFQNFMLADNTYDVEKILEVGEGLARKKQKQINDNIFRLNSLRQNFERDDLNDTGLIMKGFEKRYFLTEEFDVAEFSMESYWESLSRLYKKLVECDLTPSINQGQCLFSTETGVKIYNCIEIKGPDISLPDVISIPSGMFSCEMFEYDDLDMFKEKYYTSYPTGTIIVGVDVIGKKISDKILPFEIQILRK